ncbi:MAG: citrate lyase holo-[acyl-carrier protein] synthase [Lachnospiraceae bacterium]|nr:citrate lyase holo-[acyl-carrier protein] synthase [Lachnospiraceae bacterium]
MNDVSLLEMLNAREMRCQLQQQLLNTYKKPLICLTMNIPGPVKLLPGVPNAFSAACAQIENLLKERLILVLHMETVKQKTGYEAFYCIDSAPEFAKELMIVLEEQDALGRLFDIDVLRPDGTKVSREELGYPARRCLLCKKPAHVCSRSRHHRVEELTAEINRILNTFIEEGN